MMFINSVSFPGENGTDCRRCEDCGTPITLKTVVSRQPRYPADKFTQILVEKCPDCADAYNDNWNESDSWAEAHEYNFNPDY